MWPSGGTNYVILIASKIHLQKQYGSMIIQNIKWGNELSDSEHFENTFTKTIRQHDHTKY
jgi:hypothetical protein